MEKLSVENCCSRILICLKGDDDMLVFSLIFLIIDCT